MRKSFLPPVATSRTAVASFVAALLAALPAQATFLTPGNILVSSESSNSAISGTISEVTTSGSVVQRFSVPYPGGNTGTELLRGISVDPTGRIDPNNGTFAPYLTTVTPTTASGSATYTSVTTPGFGTVNNVSFGGLAVQSTNIFASSITTALPGSTNGIVEFNTTNSSFTRIGQGTDYGTLTVGGNALLYGVVNQSGSTPARSIDVYNPYSGTLLNTITLSNALLAADIRGLAVGQDGTLYGAGWDGNIYRFNSAGVVLGQIASGANNLESIALDDRGDLVVGSRFGDVILTTTALTSESRFTIGSDPVHVTFATPLTTVPEPASIVLLGLGGLALFASKLRRGGTR